MREIASSIEYCLSPTCAEAAVNFFPCFAMFLLVVLAAASRPPTNSQLPTSNSQDAWELASRRLGVSSASADDVYSHRPRSAANGLDRRLQIRGVEIRHFLFRDVLDLLC